MPEQGKHLISTFLIAFLPGIPCAGAGAFAAPISKLLIHGTIRTVVSNRRGSGVGRPPVQLTATASASAWNIKFDLIVQAICKFSLLGSTQVEGEGK